MADNDLQKRIEKLGEQLVTDIEAWEKRTRTERAQVLDQLSHTLEEKVGAALTKLAEKGHHERARIEKRERRRAERQARKQQEPTTAGGIVFLIAAVICAVMGIVNPQMWWMVFVALGLGLGGAGQLAGAAKRRKELAAEKAEAEPVEPVKARASTTVHEVDALCDALLAELATAPETVRTFVSDPQKTVTSMRATLKSLDLRRQQLLGEDAAGRLAAARAQHTELQARHDATGDAETKLRMEEALRSMSSQEAALQHLLVMTERVDGEYTSLLVHLQELRTRVSVARSSSTSVQLEGVKASVQRLNDELGAISEAMDAVRRGDLSPVSAVDEGDSQPKGRSRVAD
ncbi:MAG: hypothetical protein Q8S33_28345 [Myxococcales bacterium]|nr:hypothetical protein [Myxococcales bacterium]